LTLEATFPDGTRVELHPRPCGTGCRTQRLALPEGPTRLTVRATADGWVGGDTELSLNWPPAAEEPDRFDAMHRAMQSVEQLGIVEFTPDDDPADQPQTRLAGEEFVALMPWAGGGVTDVRTHPDDPHRFTFFLPGSSMWFDVTVDERDRLVSQRLVNPGHDIRYRFSYES
jgi:copper transport protein